MTVLVVIHLGSPAAGSAAIQDFLSVNRDALRALSVDYPTIGRGEGTQHRNLANELTGAAAFDPALGTFDDLYVHARRDSSETRVISADGFAGLDPAHMEALKRNLRGPGVKFRVVMLVRDPLELVRADYADRVMLGAETRDFDACFAALIPQIDRDIFRTAQTWAEMFLWKRLGIRVVSERDLANGDVVDHFLIAAGVSARAPQVHALPRPTPADPAQGWKTLEAMRALYGGRHGLGRDHPLIDFMAARRPGGGGMIAAAAGDVARRLGWGPDQGLYLTRAQAALCLESRCACVSALNAHLPAPLPGPLDLEARRFVEREFLPDVARIAKVELAEFYEQVGTVLARQDAVLKRAAGIWRPPPRVADLRPPTPRQSRGLSDPDPEDFGPAASRKIAKEVKALLAGNDRQGAVRHAMDATQVFLAEPTDAVRLDLRNRVFKQLSSNGDSYQSKDFECVDYQVYELAPDLPLFRGPRVPAAALERGDYFCVLGAAQTYGRLVRDPWPQRVSRAVGLPVLNLSRSGAGPEFFLDARLIDYARNARFVVLQVMSGRSVGCEEYPGGRRITRVGKTEVVHRRDVLQSLWSEDPATALHYVRRWNANYLALYRQLRERIDRPTLLLWISDRSPSGWSPERLLNRPNWGSFPQLVGEGLYRDVAALFEERFEMKVELSNEQPLSRFTGEACPYFGDGGKALHQTFQYYPSSASHALLAEALTPWARDAAARGDGSGRY